MIALLSITFFFILFNKFLSSELIINSSRDKSRIGLLKDKKLVEFHQETDETKFNVGDIYVGKVKKIIKA